MLETLEIEPRGSVRRAVIWLHGLGADGHDFEPLVHQWGLADELGARFVLPHAPVMPVTLNGGMPMRAWFDIYDLHFDGREDAAGIERARRHLLAMIEREQRRGIAGEHILLAGFSQGGAAVLHTVLRYRQPLAGALALSSYLPLRQSLGADALVDPAQLTLRMDHGVHDSVVPFAAAQRSLKLLQERGYSVEFNSYPMDHGLCPQQMASLRAWLVERLA
jgi:phospholipase/carboxylesterase